MTRSDAADGRASAPAVRALRAAFDSLAPLRVVLFGGKGGVGKTTIASLAALHFSESRDVTLFTTDPASNLEDVFRRRDGAGFEQGGPSPAARARDDEDGERDEGRLRIEAIDGERLYRQFLDVNLEPIVELGDRGTYLERDEIRSFLELALPGIDELMAWKRIGDLAADEQRLVVVDTAPTGHTLRMLASGSHFERFVAALDAMQAKHHALVEQFTRRSFRDAIDEFLASFEADAKRTAALLRDAGATAFVPVFLPEPWVVDQTARLTRKTAELGLRVPFAIVNRAPAGCDCSRCRERSEAVDDAAGSLAMTIVRAPDACGPLDSPERLRQYLDGGTEASAQPVAAAAIEERTATRTTEVPDPADPGLSTTPAPRAWENSRNGSGSPSTLTIPRRAGGAPRLLFFAGKGGVGKTSCATSVALQLARPERPVVLLSIDPAHSVIDVFARFPAPQGLTVEAIDTRAEWASFREMIEKELGRAFAALTPAGLSLEHDGEVVERLLEMAPPGADEIFALMRIADLTRDVSIDTVVVDTAPTGHFLRLLELPETGGAWVREFMRLLLRYRNLVPPGILGEKLVEASRDLKDFSAAAAHATIVVVTRPEEIVLAETSRLVSAVRDRGLPLSGTIVNYLTPESDCRCDLTRRGAESAAFGTLVSSLPAPLPLVPIERRAAPPESLADLRNLVPLEETEPS